MTGSWAKPRLSQGKVGILAICPRNQAEEGIEVPDRA